MLAWTKANGGPLALAVLGLGVGGFTNRYVGIVLIVVGCVWFVASHIVSRRRGPQEQHVEKSPEVLLGEKALRDALGPPERQKWWASYLAHHLKAGQLRIPFGEPPKWLSYRLTPPRPDYPLASIGFEFSWWDDYELICTVTNPDQVNAASVIYAQQMMQGNRFMGNYPKNFTTPYLTLQPGPYEFRWSKVHNGLEGQVLWRDRLNVDFALLDGVDPHSHVLLEREREIVSKSLLPLP
jgi:hypothetical protein